MKRHTTDTVSLVFGLIFLGIVGLWVVGLFVDFDIPHFGWIAALGLIVLGLLGVVASLRGGGRDITDDSTREGTTGTTGDGVSPADTTVAQNDASSAWTDPGTDTAAGTAGGTDIRDADSIHVGRDDRPDWPSR